MGLSRPIINEKTGGEVATYLYYHTHPPGGLQRYYADNVIGGPGAFALQIVNFDAFANAMTEKLMTYALGRTVEYRDMPTVRKIVEDSAKDDYKFQSIVMGIIDSDQVQMRSVPQEAKPKTQTAQNEP